MLCCVDPPEQSTGHAVMSLDLQAALGAIERGAEERLEILRDKKRQLETSEVKPQLVGHVEVDEKGELLKVEAEPEESDESTEDGGARKRRVTQSIVSIWDAKQKENIEKQERRWFALAVKKTTASASLGAPPAAMETTTETPAASSLGAEGTAPTAVTSTVEGGMVDLEATMLSQGDDDDDVYGKKYRTTSEDRTDRSAARAKQKEDREKQEREHAALRYAEAQLQKEVEEHKKQEAQQALLETEEKTVEERRKLSEHRQKARLERKAAELQKQKQRDKECREKGKEKVEEEEEAMMDDTDKDKDYNPDAALKRTLWKKTRKWMTRIRLRLRNMSTPSTSKKPEITL